MIKLKKAILALFISCLLTGTNVQAMDSEDKKGQESQHIGSDPLVSHFSDLKLSPEQIQVLSKKLEESCFLEILMKTSTSQEIARLKAEGKGNNLFPSVDPLKIMNLINELLIPKYVALLMPNFAPKSLDVSQEHFMDVIVFLKNNESFIRGDLCSDHSLVLLLKLICYDWDLDSTFPSGMSPGFLNLHNDPSLTKRNLLMRWSKVEGHQLFVDPESVNVTMAVISMA